jgi:hypothetical protein
VHDGLEKPKRSWPYRGITLHVPGGSEEDHGHLFRISGILADIRDLAPPKYKYKALFTDHPFHSVTLVA